ncbi:MAG: zinc dependent phospholipase C family protein [Clostridium sp.]
MATWVSHFRIANYFLDKLQVEHKNFIVGNIGPDCGEPNEDWTSFSPSSSITHFTPTGSKSKIKYEDFYEKYLSDTTNLTKESYSFYLGYYIHLLTDVNYSKNIAKPKVNYFIKEIDSLPKLIQLMKEDWYDLDHLYLQTNPDFYPFKVFSNIKDFKNVYLDFYSDTAFIKQITYITSFYKASHDNLNREYPYLNKNEMDNFVLNCCKEIESILKDKEIIT